MAPMRDLRVQCVVLAMLLLMAMSVEISAEPTTTPEPTTATEPTAASEPTATPEPTTTSEPTITPEPTTTSEPTTAPEPTTTPEPITATEPTAASEPTTAPEPTTTPGPTAISEPATTPEAITTPARTTAAPEAPTALSTPAAYCTDIHGDAFGNESIKTGVCYLVSEDKGMFHDARTFCQGLNDNLGWDVADIEDAEENDLIQDALAALKSSGSFSSVRELWIGQNDLKTEHVWRYLNDSSNKCNRTVYLNWAHNQPNEGLRQNCVAYIYNEDGKFHDRRCDETYNYLCKVKITTDEVPLCADFIEDNSTEALDECQDVLPGAFGNPLMPGMCYFSGSDQKFFFEEALSFCESLSGGSWSVADIEDADENLFLEAWNRDNFPNNNGYWIGQNDREQEGEYRYTSSRQCPVHLNWRYDQPDDVREQNCLVMFKRDDGQFQDKACREKYYTLCKLKTDPGPTQNPLTSCNVNTLSPEVAACSNLHAEAFGSVDNPGVCYFMTGQQVNWESAVDYCQGIGWSLIDIEDATENEIVVARHSDFRPLELQHHWVGQNDREIEGTWKYSSKDTPSDAGVFLNWASNQPGGGTNQNCIMVDKSFLWQDKECSDQYYVTCKKRIRQATTDPCTDYSPVSRSRRFLFLSANATCRPQAALTPSSRANSRVQCARKCLLRDNCRSFGFAASGKEDDCELCSEFVLNVRDLQFKTGSLYYYEAL